MFSFFEGLEIQQTSLIQPRDGPFDVRPGSVLHENRTDDHLGG